MKKILFIVLFCSISKVLIADPPEPEIGERWVLNPNYSDEFNGTALDLNKWRTRFNGWLGRPPAYFSPNTISVNDGNMIIRNSSEVPANAPGNYTMSGGAVQTIKEDAHFGYYECNFKASRINMSTTFWLSSSARQEPRTADGNDTYSQELDICESIGGTGNFSSDFRKKMKFNTHYRLRPDPGAKEIFYSKGNNQVEIRDGELVGGDASLKTSESWEAFHTYACYWKSAKEASFYVDNRFIGKITFITDIVPDPFKDPMRINLVAETYTWAQPYPTDAQLNNNNINASFYNWVRTYKKIGIEEIDTNTTNDPSIPGEIANIDFEDGSLAGWSKFGPVPDNLESTDTHNGSKFSLKVNGAVGGREYQVTVKPNTDYTLKAQIKALTGAIAFGIKQQSAPGTTLASQSIMDSAFKEITLNFNSGSDTALKFFLFAAGAGDSGIADNFELFETNPNAPTTPSTDLTYKLPEELNFYEAPKLLEGNSKVEISYLYKTNKKNTLRIIVLDENQIEIDRVSFDVLEGYGKNVKTLNLASALTIGEYTFKGEIVETTDNGEFVLSDSEGFSRVEPINIANSNFMIKTLGLTCPNSDNGKIEIKADKASNYKAEIEGIAAKDFNSKILFENLKPGTYQLNITAPDFPEYIQKYSIRVADVNTISAKTIVDNENKKLTINLNGAKNYQIKLNNKTFLTSENEIILDLQVGENNISINGEKNCQGKFSEKVIIGDNNPIIIYPNPANNIINVINTLPNTSLSILDVNGKVIKSNDEFSFNQNSNSQSTNIDFLAKGIYFLKVGNNGNQKIVKFLKD